MSGYAEDDAGPDTTFYIHEDLFRAILLLC